MAGGLTVRTALVAEVGMAGRPLMGQGSCSQCRVPGKPPLWALSDYRKTTQRFITQIVSHDSRLFCLGVFLGISPFSGLIGGQISPYLPGSRISFNEAVHLSFALPPKA